MRYIWVALAIGVLVMGCGGGSTGTAGPQDTGRIFVRNDSRAILEVSSEITTTSRSPRSS